MSHAILIVLDFPALHRRCAVRVGGDLLSTSSKNYPLNQRLELIAPDGRETQRRNESSDAARKRSVEDTLRENADLAAAKAKKAKPSLTARLRQAQLKLEQKDILRSVFRRCRCRMLASPFDGPRAVAGDWVRPLGGSSASALVRQFQAAPSLQAVHRQSCRCASISSCAASK